MSSTAVFIDGGRFYDALHSRACSVDIDYAALVRALVAPAEVGAMYFYFSPIPSEPYPARTRHHQAVVNMVADQGFTVRTGRTEVVYSAFVERGIEGLMATDIVSAAHSADVDSMVIISQRQDLIPAVTAAQAVGKSVEVAYFVNGFDPTPTELSDTADRFTEITVRDILDTPVVGPTPHRVASSHRNLPTSTTERTVR